MLFTLDRTKGVSSTQLRNKTSINLGIIIVRRFKSELKFVGVVNLVGLYDQNNEKSKLLAKDENIYVYDSLQRMYEDVDAVYICVPPKYHYQYVKASLFQNKHILCEFPFSLVKNETKELFEIANKREVILMEALKTAYCPAFCKIVPIVKNGMIGNILSVDACFTKVHGNKIDEQIKLASGGSMNALSSYPLLAIFKILGTDFQDINFISNFNLEGIDIFTKFNVFF